MTTIHRLAPAGPPAAVEELVAGSSHQTKPFEQHLLDFCDVVSSRIFKHPESRAHPELLALAFWIRRASIARLAQDFRALDVGDGALVPRGLVFHIPPANVDTIFVYSFVLALLAGNRNIVRLSSRANPQSAFLCAVLAEAMAEARFERIRQTTAIVSYDHDDAITATLSAACDVRVVWGGDGTVEQMRRYLIRPSAKELVFPDRFSFAVIRTDGYLEADEDTRSELARLLFNDAYWFDQMGCSSPRLVVWCGCNEADAAGADLWARLEREVRDRGYKLEPGAATAKLAFIYGALIDRPVTALARPSNELTVLSLASLDDFDRTHPGAGTFFEATIDSPEKLSDFVARKDQTVTAFGFDADELAGLARNLNGRGIDRIVPFGEALTFSRFWDGYDLLLELTRRVDIPSTRLLKAV